MDSKERVMVFVDSSNLFHALKRLGLKIDYYKLVKELVGNRTLVRPYYYGSKAPYPKSLTQDKFHRALQHEGFEVITKPIKTIHENIWVEKGVDIALATDILINAFRNLFDTAILVSGDSDFVTTLAEIKRLGKRVEVAAFDNTIDQGLKGVADRYVSLDNLWERIRQQKT